MDTNIQQALDTLFANDSKIYQNRGFQRRVGYGTRPALINIDLANAWTRPDHAFTCDGIDEIIEGVQHDDGL
jgi:N-carbamoylsarcosine amidase